MSSAKKDPSINENASKDLSLFHPLIRRWFQDRVGPPTDIQKKGWPCIASGGHVLMVAPTGCGKTLAAFLWALNLLITGAGERKRVLYISPLKALNSDIGENLRRPLNELQHLFSENGVPFPPIRIDIRSGDTGAAERRRMLRSPAEIFITTPESLNIILASPGGHRLLQDIGTVILDEVHSLLSEKRGTFLITAIERLVPLNGEFQRIALSATVNPMQSAADFTGGFKPAGPDGSGREKRRVRIIHSDMIKKIDLEVDRAGGEGIGDTEAAWTKWVESCRQRFKGHRSTLVFANSRRVVEKASRLLNEQGESRVYSHHGSLSRELRADVEKKFREGELTAMTATSSLELGIDIGSVDQVLLIQPPPSLASARQRIGRSGHGVGETARGIFQPLFTQGLIESAVQAKAIAAGEIDPVKTVEAPLDVLAQLILSMTCDREVFPDDLFGQIRCSWPYRDLSRERFDRVVEMLTGRYSEIRVRELQGLLMIDPKRGSVQARSMVRLLLYFSGGIIPDRGAYILRQSGSRARIGELDEEFVWERSVGDTFPFGPQVWRIRRITANDVEVDAVSQGYGLVPFWRGEEFNRSFALSERIGQFLEEADSLLEKEDFQVRLQNEYFMTPSAGEELIALLRRQRSFTRLPLPHRHHLVVERIDSPAGDESPYSLVIHNFWGGRINRPFAMVLEAALENAYGEHSVLFSANDSILLQTNRPLDASDLFALLVPDRIRTFLRSRLENSALFGARFRANAQRALLLPRAGPGKRTPLWVNRQRAKRLLEKASGFSDFPIVEETWRECLEQELDVESLMRLLAEIESGEIRISETRTEHPSPFADAVLWKRTNQFMYEDDTPRRTSRSRLQKSILDGLLLPSALRPRFSDSLLEEFRRKRQRLAPGYSPSSSRELLHWIGERLIVPSGEWMELLAAIERDHGLNSEQILAPIASRLVEVQLGGKVESAVMTSENETRWRRMRTGNDTPDSDSTAAFIMELLRFYGPVSPGFITGLLGVGKPYVAEILDMLANDGRIVVDEFRESSSPENALELCDSENLDILLRMRRNRARPVSAMRPLHELPLFLARHQGLIGRASDPSGLPGVLEKMFGYPAEARMWESEVFPARFHHYRTSWLDDLFSNSQLLWYGCGKERISFCMESDCGFFLSGHSRRHSAGSADKHEIEKLREFFFNNRGRFSLADLAAELKLPTEAVTHALWSMAWNGEASNNQYKTLRQGILNGFRAETPARTAGMRSFSSRKMTFGSWLGTRAFSGYWFPLSRLQDEPLEPMLKLESSKDIARQLFLRYGILFRELFSFESRNVTWSELLPVLRVMELSGEIVSGKFFKGVEGLQFVPAETADEFHSTWDTEDLFWMNAADPASPCGLPLPWENWHPPPRLRSTHIVFSGVQPLLVSRKNGRELEILPEPGEPKLHEALGFYRELLEREFAPLKSVMVSEINGESALKSPFIQILSAAGFERDYRGLTLRRLYS